MPREVARLDTPAGPLTVEALDETSAGGAPVCYRVRGDSRRRSDRVSVFLAFAAGGSAGLTDESLLAVVIDRLEGSQGGKLRCPENAEALGHLRRALECLGERAEGRKRRGVLGKAVP